VSERTHECGSTNTRAAAPTVTAALCSHPRHALSSLETLLATDETLRWHAVAAAWSAATVHVLGKHAGCHLRNGQLAPEKCAARNLRPYRCLCALQAARGRFRTGKQLTAAALRRVVTRHALGAGLCARAWGTEAEACRRRTRSAGAGGVSVVRRGGGRVRTQHAASRYTPSSAAAPVARPAGGEPATCRLVATTVSLMSTRARNGCRQTHALASSRAGCVTEVG
jgi:hypothetical protein